MSDAISDLAPRVAVLEEIARGLKVAIDRMDRRFDALESAQRSDFRWLLGAMIGGFSATLAGFAAVLGVLAHGFHWI